MIATPPMPAQNSSMLEAVRAVTRAAHVRIEASASMRRLVSAEVTTGDYVAHLSRLLGFYEPLEVALTHTGSEMPAFLSLHRSDLLKRDLDLLDVTAVQVDGLPRCTVASIDSAGLPGVLYVYEGAALGGQIIARHLQATLQLPHRFGFYREDGSATGRNWKAFCAFLNAIDASRVDAVCSAAVAAFGLFETWVKADLGADSTEANR